MYIFETFSDLLNMSQMRCKTYHEVDTGATTENVGDGNHSAAARKPLRWARVVERSGLGVQLHVPWVDTWAENPWVVQVALSSFNKQDLEVVVQVGQSASDDTSVQC